MKKFNLILVIVLFCIFTIQSVSVTFQTISNSNSSNGLVVEDPRNLETNVVLINYEYNQLLLQSLNSELDKEFFVKSGATYKYTMKYNFIFPNNTFNEEFTLFIHSISNPNSSTVDVNQTALKIQAENNSVQDIFFSKNGTSIDGIAVENWLWSHYDQFELQNTSYQIFLLNLTFLGDTYWFNIPEIDESSKQQRSWWRLEWDYPPIPRINNFDAKFPYPGYASNYPLYYLDPSAFNWYLNWTRIWRNLVDTSENVYYRNNFASYVESIGGLSSNSSYNLAGSYIGKWLNEIVNNLFLLSPLSTINIPKSLNLQIAVFTDETSSNQYPDLTWSINSSLIIEKIYDLIPESDISIELHFYTLENSPGMNSLLNSANIKNTDPFDGKNPVDNFTYYNGNNLWTSIPQQDSTYFNLSNAETTLRGYVFILDNASFYGANWAGGGLFTGLGGNNRLLILNEIDRLYFNRTSEPVRKSSLSKVFVHEVGHAIGLPHPFEERSKPYYYASDFINEVMGYYSDTTDFSFIYKTNFQRLNLEPKISQLLYDLSNLNDASSIVISNIQNNYNSFLNSYRKLNFQEANDFIEIIELLINSNFNIENPIKAPILTISPQNQIIYVGDSLDLSWLANDQNPSNYSILVNNTIKKSGFWNNQEKIIFEFSTSKEGNYNISLVVADLNMAETTDSVLIIVLSLPKSSESHNTAFFGFSDPELFLGMILVIIIKRKKSGTFK